jgi:SNF2 family DNA or RNA helicase
VTAGTFTCDGGHDFSQAVGRIARIGQSRPTRCVRLVVAGSLEPNILAWQRRRVERASLAVSAGAQLGIEDLAAVLGTGGPA